jgi:hypothetical protein
MSDELDQEAVDSAIILENKVNERVEREVNKFLSRQVEKMVANEVHKAFATYKKEMMLEISITIGKMLRVADEEERKPLWETDLKELGFEPVSDYHALHKDPKAV